jgi:hypothetical protein
VPTTKQHDVVPHLAATDITTAPRRDTTPSVSQHANAALFPLRLSVAFVPA